MSNKEFENFFKRLGEYFRKLRLSKGMTQEDLLDHGFATRHYQRIEKGLPISMKTALRLAAVFNVKLYEILKEIEQSPY